MKLHDLRPAEGSRKPRTRVGRGIAAGKGKTAGRGTKGQKARTGGTIQPWFEGGQTPIHVRVPKLRGFRNLFRVEYEVVNVGKLSELAETGVLDAPELAAAEGAKAPAKAGKPAPVTITPDILAAVGLVRSLDKPLKILGHGDVKRPLFVIADAFSKSAQAKIEAAGGTAQVLEFPGHEVEVEVEAEAAPAPKAAPAARAKPAKTAETGEAPEAEAEAEAEEEAPAGGGAQALPGPRARLRLPPLAHPPPAACGRTPGIAGAAARSPLRRSMAALDPRGATWPVSFRVYQYLSGVNPRCAPVTSTSTIAPRTSTRGCGKIPISLMIS
jgi:large subunit ribosomal protein L15